MEQVQPTESSASVPAGSAGENTQGDQANQPAIKYEDHKRALEDMKKAKAKAKELESRLAELETQKLQEQGEWKTLAEREKDLRQQAETKAESLRNDLFTSKKFEEVAKEAQKAGLRTEALSDLELLALEGVEVERTSHGRMIIHGAESFVQDLKRKRPHWFAQPTAPTVNSGGSTAVPAPSKITPEMIFEAEKKGDKAKVKELTALYLKQR